MRGFYELSRSVKIHFLERNMNSPLGGLHSEGSFESLSLGFNLNKIILILIFYSCQVRRSRNIIKYTVIL